METALPSHVSQSPPPGHWASHNLNRSYFVVNDSIWGMTSHFSYYSQFRRDWAGIKILEAVMISAIFVLAVPLNIFVLFVLNKSSSRPQNAVRRAHGMYVTNLSAAGLLLMLTLPPVAATRITEHWLLSNFFCGLLFHLQVTCGNASIWTKGYRQIFWLTRIIN